MGKKIREFIPIVALALIPTFLIWLPFFLRFKTFWTIPLPQSGMAAIVSNYDGPLFIVVAKTLYNIPAIGGFPFTLPAAYYAAHFPFFPLLIRLFSVIFGYPYAMLTVTLVSSVLAVYFFVKLASEYVDRKDVLWMTFVFSIFPARWLIVRSVGSSEPLFLAATIASIYYFNKNKYLSSGIWGSLAILTKSPGILLFISYILAIITPRLKGFAVRKLTNKLSLINYKRYLPLLLIPFSLLGLFVFYKYQYGDFFAYFHSGDNIHLFFPPFQIFNFAQPWVGTFWLEEVIFVYLFGILGLARLINKKESLLSWFVGIFFVSIIFVSHRDIIRYALPIVPFLLISFADTIVKKEFKIAIAVLAIPVYLYSLAYISQNVMPIADWAPLL